jgi:hypothetical protein
MQGEMKLGGRGKAELSCFPSPNTKLSRPKGLRKISVLNKI